MMDSTVFVLSRKLDKTLTKRFIPAENDALPGNTLTSSCSCQGHSQAADSCHMLQHECLLTRLIDWILTCAGPHQAVTM